MTCEMMRNQFGFFECRYNIPSYLVKWFLLLNLFVCQDPETHYDDVILQGLVLGDVLVVYHPVRAPLNQKQNRVLIKCAWFWTTLQRHKQFQVIIRFFLLHSCTITNRAAAACCSKSLKYNSNCPLIPVLMRNCTY